MTWMTSAATTQPAFDWSLVWTVAGAVFGLLALIGVVYAVVGYYRDHPKRQLEYKVRSRRLVQGTPKAKLEVRVNGIDVPDPHLVEFRMAANSRADIPSTAFDAGRSLSIRIEPGGAFMVGDIPNKGIVTSGGEGDGWVWAQFDVAPQLIRKKSELHLDFISSGAPKIVVSSPLVDVPVVNVTRRPSKSDVATAWFILGISAFTLVTNFITPITNPQSETPVWLYWTLAVFFAAMTVGAVALVRHRLRWRKLDV